MDLINRQVAIKDAESWVAIDEYEKHLQRDVIEWLKKFPSAQPEIIYCKDCKYKDDGISEDGIPFLKCLHGRSYGGTRINDFCSWAEKKEYELKSCPFCGGKARLYKIAFFSCEAKVMCPTCRIQTTTYKESNMDNAV